MCSSSRECDEPDDDELHTCPYAEEIGDDYETTCTCCAECAAECAYEI